MENRHNAILSKALKLEYHDILIPLNLKKCHSKLVHVFKTNFFLLHHVFKTIKLIYQPIVFSCDKICYHHYFSSTF